MISWPPELVLDLARRRAVLVLGAGVSMNATNATGGHPPLWDEFLQRAIVKAGQPKTWNKSVKTLLRQNDYLTACDVIKSSMGPPQFRQFMRDQFLTPGYHPAKIHDTLIRIDSRLVLTPNYDKIFENRINALQHNTVLVKNYYDVDIAEAVRTPGRVILKAHGTIDSAGEVIFTRTDYAKARQTYRAFYFILDALAATHTFLFIGCGMNDPDVRLLLEDHAFRSIHFVPHFLVAPRTAVRSHVKQTLERSLGVRMLLFDPRDDYAEFHLSLEDLANQVETCRATLSSAQW